MLPYSRHTLPAALHAQTRVPYTPTYKKSGIQTELDYFITVVNWEPARQAAFLLISPVAADECLSLAGWCACHATGLTMPSATPPRITTTEIQEWALEPLGQHHHSMHLAPATVSGPHRLSLVYLDVSSLSKALKVSALMPMHSDRQVPHWQQHPVSGRTSQGLSTSRGSQCHSCVLCVPPTGHQADGAYYFITDNIEMLGRVFATCVSETLLCLAA